MSAALGIADACTPLQALLHNAPLADSVTADFKKGTWTFTLPNKAAVASGKYVILPAILARLALENESACANQGVQLQPLANLRGRFHECGDGQIALSIHGDNGHEHTLYRDYQPTERTATYWRADHWRGHQERQDATGKAWRSMATYITDDFGSLVEVPR